MPRPPRRAFTLVELLVVLVIAAILLPIVVLIAVIVVALQTSSVRSKRAGADMAADEQDTPAPTEENVN